MKYCRFLPLLVFVIACDGQVPGSAKPVSYTTVGTYSKNFIDVFSFTKNQAALANEKNTAIGIYTEKRFLLQQIKTFATAISFPFMKGGAGLAIDYTNFAGLSQSHFGLAYGRPLGKQVDLGIQFNYHRISVSGYGSASTLNVELGVIFHLTDKVHVGCHVYNAVGGKFGKNAGEKIPSVYTLGIGYEASDKLYIGTEIIKEEKQPVDFKVTLHYAFEKQFFVRGGISSSIGNYFAGAGISWKKMRFDVAADWHPGIGLTPSLMLVFMRSKSKAGAE